MGSEGKSLDDNGEDKEHRGKNTVEEVEKEKPMKPWVQRRKYRPLGSAFGGQAPQNRSLAGAASSFVPVEVCTSAKKSCQIGSKYPSQKGKKIAINGAKKMEKIGRD